MTSFPLPVREGETFTFENLVYDVSGLKRLINRNPRLYGPHETPLDQALLDHLALYSEPDQQRIASLTEAELEIPCIAVSHDAGTRFVDGYHRVHRRWREGRKTVTIFRVSKLKTRPYVRRGA
jgi:hypothetical protein